MKGCRRGGALFLVLAMCLTLLPVRLFAAQETLAVRDAETKTLTVANAAKIDAGALAAMEIQTSDGAAVTYAEIQNKVESLVLEDVAALEGRGLFAKLTQLKHVSAAGADTIGQYTFSDCRKLANIEITGRSKESGVYQEGEEIKIRFVPAEGYLIKAITIDRELMPKDWDGRIVMDRDHEVIVATVRAGGDIQPTGDQSAVIILGALLAAVSAACVTAGKRKAVRK
ncbi:MAG: hypothetical protein KH354_03015 [Clostridiales bacterium]|nr:hypothetical protein [Clostridiales bacterium]